MLEVFAGQTNETVIFLVKNLHSLPSEGISTNKVLPEQCDLSSVHHTFARILKFGDFEHIIICNAEA